MARLVPSNALRIKLQRAKGVKIGQNVYLGYDTHIDTAYPDLVEIEDSARVAIGAVVLAHSRPADGWMKHLGEQKAPVRIKRHAAVYAGAILTPGVTVGEYAIVKEGAVVVEDVPPYTVVAGVPARVIETLPKERALDGARVHPP
jgi:acetyltransferase-like isoleucine patch superfamily enzyme